MSAAAKSIYYFGLYLYVVGLTLIFVPNLLLTTLQMPATSEVWIRIVGVLAFCIGFYYHRCGSANDLGFARLTIVARTLVFISFVVFVILEYVSPVLVAFGVVDLLGALWTWTALKEKPAQPSPSTKR